MSKGRFAPSPTGRMHLGNVVSALLSYLSAKKDGGKWLLRIEDLDPQRCKEEYARTLEEDLVRLGLEWDEGGMDADGGMYRQSRRGEIYAEALERLSRLPAPEATARRQEAGEPQDPDDRQAARLTYPCYCSRADLMAAGAPHESDGRVVYPGTCRNLAPEQRPSGKNPAIRIQVPDKDIAFTDGHYGRQVFNLARDCGDFILRRADGIHAYQLAVVVDDAAMGVTQVVRGRDLLLSTAQQIYLYDLLGLEAPAFFHTPLICARDGRRLCKRDKSTDLGEMLKTKSPVEIIGIAAFCAGILKKPEACSPADLLKIYDPEALPREDILLRTV